MSPVSPVSTQALARLRAYLPPASIYTSLPLTRRAAVLVLLFSDRRGDLRVVLTVRSVHLRTFAGQVALPGGKADFLSETAAQTARREAWEEIGLPLDSQGGLPKPFDVEHLCELPCSLARTGLAVRPCVAYLDGGKGDVEDSLIPRLQETEVASLFTVKLEPFLKRAYPIPGGAAEETWYRGGKTMWVHRPWTIHEFNAPVWEGSTLKRHRIWGMTARILVDVARVAYGRDPEFPFDQELGFEEAMREMEKKGEMKEIVKKKPDPELEPDKVAAQVEKGNL
ncbi:NUDIX hydrolase domain-like protein [Tricharina praecox]|uniref:NUDIX hydrolase domain-like protein n=1 Tax=Tricharina praecox TaxID=43433 RepID=UPI00221EE258|nr:NUDIX hydrolase domain-like protein [Tricharina praecox]KAI5844258.1 NUDIX hydrolase domain-like protein [Tricharina praecox]